MGGIVGSDLTRHGCLRPARQYKSKVACPGGGILAGGPAKSLGTVQDRFDSSPKARDRFRLG